MLLLVVVVGGICLLGMGNMLLLRRLQEMGVWDRILRFLSSFRDTLRSQRIQKDEVSGRKAQRMAKNIQKSNNKIRETSNNVQSNNNNHIHNNDTHKVWTKKGLNILKPLNP